VQNVDIAVSKRLEAVAEWILRQNNPAAAEQRHLDSGSIEQLYWHMGYHQALNDLKRAQPGAQPKAVHKAGKAI
jgi:hypothetical protein